MSIDPDDLGVAERWFAHKLSDTAQLPASLEAQGVGNTVTLDTPWTGDVNDRSLFTSPNYACYRSAGNFKVPFFLQPNTWYRGPAWYQREIVVPKHWRGKRIVLFLERAHWETQVWIGDRFLGRSEALHVPHEHSLGILAPGTYRLTIRVDNRMIVQIGHNGHGVTDHTQGNWNGIVGRIELLATEQVWIDDLQLYPELSASRLRVVGLIGNISGRAGQGVVSLSFADIEHRTPISWDVSGTRFEVELRVPPSKISALGSWDEFSPTLHDFVARLDNGEERRTRFGWRDFKTDGRLFTINETVLFFRGTLECAIFPLTGHPPMDPESWRQIMRVIKSFGLNHIRFHSYCPPEAAFDAADEAGVYVQVETVWANQTVHIGGGLPVDKWIYDETYRILKAHGNHPSFVLMAHGNEPGQGPEADGVITRDKFLARYVEHFAALDVRRRWTSGAGWPEIAANQFHITPTPRIQAWGQELNSRINRDAPETVSDYRSSIDKFEVPVIAHEIGQWCAYPNLAERIKYTGYLKAKNFDIFADRLAENDMGALAHQFLMASGKLQTLCYKEEVESALRTPTMGGFQMLELHDFPGQGTAPVGILDAFWDEKGYATSAEFRRFAGATVPLARLSTRVTETNRPFAFKIDVAHFGATAIKNAEIAWKICCDAGETFAQGVFPPCRIEVGNAPISLAAAADLSNVRSAKAAKLIVSINAAGNVIAENDWDIWIYPVREAPRIPSDLRIAARFNANAERHLENGGKLLLTLPGSVVTNFDAQPVKLGFSSIFWNTAWTARQAPTTLGLLCDPAHPALATFPTEYHSNWQYWYLVHRAGALRLDLLPNGIEPVVRVIDDWFTARPLALIVEAAVGKGKIMVCGFDLTDSAIVDPVSRQMRDSLVRYMASDNFAPVTQVSSSQIRSL